ncbi:conserved Plasmodium protein, unknown function [Plasmodium yoelii]|uniref:Uncharacterized protein n=2 Tax=Plasmodium yoelii TaxID=5861 RepID=A0AAF0B565_PLAYO|nr:conserved Plasmodium protein, unknown function [Plasmodium yoelii]WBY58004.1 hypothetical protein Py17XNL_001002282 [Plasmodium yoelii yoelii]CDU85071.1 conserved Plasmodium protein, unknown function [Plasmodium yoelii]VTZ78966.1 conserved Plasmodium protein, unknown function [Plasmodium yoelii]|eukprot:XP_022813329.1 conserved Plasmodium protein, unknown function [Plasmodium yoelii]
MYRNKYFKEHFLYVEELETKNDEDKCLYIDYVKKCFSYLLSQNDDYIITTIKKNNSLCFFFFSHLQKGARAYDNLYIYDSYKENEYYIIDKYILEFYLKILEIYINSDKNETNIIKHTFMKVNIFMDILMMYHNLEKKKIKELLDNLYKMTKLYFFNINKYISLLYEHIKYIKEKLDKFTTKKSNVNNLIFEINEFITCVYCFTKFFKKFYLFDMEKNKLSNNLILSTLLCYDNNDNKKEHLNTLSLDILKEGKESFLYLFIQTYFEMIKKIYCGTVESRVKKDVVILRYKFIKTLKKFVKYSFIYEEEKKKHLYFSFIIDLLKEKSSEISFYFLRNDIKIIKWDFLEHLVLENKLDIEFYMYVNNILKIKNKKEIKELMKKKYEHEINQIKEITNLNNSNAILKILKKNNFIIASTLDYIFSIIPTQNLDDMSDNTSENDESESLLEMSNSENDIYNDEKINNTTFHKKNNEHNNNLTNNTKYEYADPEYNRIEHDNYQNVKNKNKNILEVLKEQELMKKLNKKKREKSKYINGIIDDESKNKILTQLNMSDSLDNDLSSSSFDNFQNKLIDPTSYRRNYSVSDEEADIEKSDHGQDQNKNIQPAQITQNKAYVNKNKKFIPPNNFKFKDPKSGDFPQKKIPPNEQNNANDDKTKRYYMKKNTNKGRFRRNQYDKKMGKGMF